MAKSRSSDWLKLAGIMGETYLGWREGERVRKQQTLSNIATLGGTYFPKTGRAIYGEKIEPTSELVKKHGVGHYFPTPREKEELKYERALKLEETKYGRELKLKKLEIKEGRELEKIKYENKEKLEKYKGDLDRLAKLLTGDEAKIINDVTEIYKSGKIPISGIVPEVNKLAYEKGIKLGGNLSDFAKELAGGYLENYKAITLRIFKTDEGKKISDTIRKFNHEILYGKKGVTQYGEPLDVPGVIVLGDNKGTWRRWNSKKHVLPRELWEADEKAITAAVGPRPGLKGARTEYPTGEIPLVKKAGAEVKLEETIKKINNLIKGEKDPSKKHIMARNAETELIKLFPEFQGLISVDANWLIQLLKQK